MSTISRVSRLVIAIVRTPHVYVAVCVVVVFWAFAAAKKAVDVCETLRGNVDYCVDEALEGRRERGHLGDRLEALRDVVVEVAQQADHARDFARIMERAARRAELAAKLHRLDLEEAQVVSGPDTIREDLARERIKVERKLAMSSLQELDGPPVGEAVAGTEGPLPYLPDPE